MVLLIQRFKMINTFVNLIIPYAITKKNKLENLPEFCNVFRFQIIFF